MWSVTAGTPIAESLSGGFEKRMTALKAAYAKHRDTFQQAYERHVNWEFTETELGEIVAFLESATGQHYLDGRWRMDAYVGTDTEDLIDQIVKEAMATASK